MNNGKLLVLGGFGIKAFVSFLDLLSLFLHFPSVSLVNILNLVASLAIVAGFGLLFLGERNILDLVIAGGFAVSSILPTIMLLVRGGGAMGMSPIAGNTLIFSIIGILALLVWAFKLFTGSNLLGAVAIGGSIALSFVVGLLVRLLPGVFITNIIAALAYIAADAALAFAALLDLQS